MKVQILESKIIYNGFFKLHEAQIEHETFDGKMQRVKRLCLERGDSVAAVVFDPATREFLFTEQFRYPAYVRCGKAVMLELVAGMSDAGESPVNAIHREIEEELGYAVKDARYLGYFFLSPGGSSEAVRLYYVEVGEKKGKGGGRVDENEDIRIVRLSEKEAKRRIWDGGFNDAKTQLGLMMSLPIIGVEE